MARCTLQEIFEQHFDAFACTRTLHPRELRAAWCIRHCFTAAAGAHAVLCPAGHFQQLQYHACRHRSCPRCAGAPRRAWIETELQRLLPCPHFQVVFTLPHELIALWAFNRQAMAGILFDCARTSLLQLMAQPRHGGVVPGLLMALHTWGRTLSYHPHLHCLISAGGLDEHQHWKPTSSTFLLPLQPLRAIFRGKLLARIKALLADAQFVPPPLHTLDHWQGLLRQLHRQHFNIEIEPPLRSPVPAGPKPAALYLARYVKGGPISAERPLQLDAKGMVRMPYTDHRDGRTKTLCLPAQQFIERVLWHAPPRGQHGVRHAGLYSASLRKHHARVHQTLRPCTPTPTAPAMQPALSEHVTTNATACANVIAAPAPAPSRTTSSCPICHARLVPRRSFTPRSTSGQISKAAALQPFPRSPTLGPTGRSTGPPTAGRPSQPAYHLPWPAGCLRPVN